jgi:hypothetical protein
MVMPSKEKNHVIPNDRESANSRPLERVATPPFRLDEAFERRFCASKCQLSQEMKTKVAY